MAKNDVEDGKGAGGRAEVDAESHRKAGGAVGADCYGAGSGRIGGNSKCKALLRHGFGVGRQMGL